MPINWETDITADYTTATTANLVWRFAAATDTNIITTGNYNSTRYTTTWVTVDPGTGANSSSITFTDRDRSDLIVQNPVEPIAIPDNHQTEEYGEERREAGERARILLLDNLSEEQREEYERLESFRVIVGDRMYRIKRGRVGNIELIDDEGIVARYCVHPEVECPDEDTMLTQKLMLENDEQELLRLANVHFQRAA